MGYIAANPERRVSTGEMAGNIRVSENHLSKVMQRLAKAGLVKSNRGPKGGFTLARSADEITMLEVFESIDGPLTDCACLLGTPVCNGGKCILGDLAEKINRDFRDYLSTTMISQITGSFGGKDNGAKKNH